jgi:hypothetical protein
MSAKRQKACPIASHRMINVAIKIPQGVNKNGERIRTFAVAHLQPP